MKGLIAFWLSGAFLALLWSVGACSPQKNGADEYLTLAQSALEQGNYEQADHYLDSVDLLYATDVAARRKARVLHDSLTTLFRETQHQMLLEQYRRVNEQIEQQISSFTLTPASSNKTLEEGQHYRHKAMNTALSSLGHILISSCTPQGWFEVTHYYIGAKSLSASSLSLTLQDGTRSSMAPLDEDGAHYARFESGGLYHETLQLPPHAAQEIGHLLLKTDSLNATPQVELLAEGKVVARYPLQGKQLAAHIATARLAELLQKRNRIEKKGRQQIVVSSRAN